MQYFTYTKCANKRHHFSLSVVCLVTKKLLDVQEEVMEELRKLSVIIHSFHWHVQNATISYCSQELLPFLSVIYPFLPPSSIYQSSILPHFILVYLSVLFPNSYIILFWEFYFLPFSVHVQTNVICSTLLSLLLWDFNHSMNFFMG